HPSFSFPPVFSLSFPPPFSLFPSFSFFLSPYAQVGFRKGRGPVLGVLCALGRRSQLEMFLGALSAVLGVLLLGCVIALGVQHRTDRSRTLCLSEACVSVAGRILDSLDRAVEPCQDFYQFSCGGWMRRNPLPDGRSRWNTFNSIWDQNQAVLKHILG
ncbi:hypothetical protein FKM82_029953, partial [Ascaphus truei]